MLGTLSAKHQLALAALDTDTDIDQVDLSSGLDELKTAPGNSARGRT